MPRSNRSATTSPSTPTASRSRSRRTEMARPASTLPGAARRSPRERLLEAAGELFYAEGVQSVGIDRVLERAGVAKASLYSTFGSKEELVRAYLDERHSLILGRLRAAVEATDRADPVARILAVFDAQAELFPAPSFHGCAFAAEAPRDGRIDEAARAYRSDIRELFTELATAAGAPDPPLLASQLQLVYDGACAAANLDRAPRGADPHQTPS